MLVIARKPGESFFIDADIEIVILKIDRGRVKIGINAKEHKVRRDNAQQ